MSRIPQASALPDPMFQVTHFVESVQTRTGPQENAFMFSQKIPWFGKLNNKELVASTEAEAIWYAYQNKQLMLARLVSLAYYEYGHTDRAIQLTEENLELLQKLEPIVEEKVKAGAGINALLRLKVEIGKVADKHQSLLKKRIAQSADLSALLALPPDELLPWPKWEAPDMFSFNTSDVVYAIEENNPELAMLKRKVASAEARQELAQLKSYPDFTLGLNYIQLGDAINLATPDAGKDPWGITFAINIPLWFNKYDAAKAEALAQKRANENEYEDKLNSLRSQLSQSTALLEDANRRIELYGNELLGLANQAVENSRSSYESGRTSILEVIDSERSLLDLQLLYWRAATDAWQQRILIQTLANQPISETF
jgi:outer membrane protein TolC